MELTVDLRQPVQKTVASREPSHLRVLGVAVDDDGALVGLGRHEYSYLAECECPGDCLRDHEND